MRGKGTLWLILLFFILINGAVNGVVAALTAEEILSVQEGDIVVGNKDAPVYIYDFSSISCVHCAHYHEMVFNKIEKEFIDNGKVFYVIKEFPTSKQAIKGVMALHCFSDPHKRFKFFNTLMRYQEKWVFTPDYEDALKNFASLAGIGFTDFERCTNDEGLEKALMQKAFDSATTLQIAATPAIFINGVMYKGPMEYDEIKNAIEAAMSGDSSAADSVDSAEELTIQ